MFFSCQCQVENLQISIPKPTFIYSFSLESSSLLTLQTEARSAAAADSPLDSNVSQECRQRVDEPPPASLGLPVLPHLSCDGVHDFHISLVLSIILQELSIGSHQVHDDGVVHLEVMGARVQDTALSQQQQQQEDESGEHSQCSRCLRPLAPDCNKLCRLWKLPPPGPLFPSGRSTWAKTLQKNPEETSVRNNGGYKE